MKQLQAKIRQIISLIIFWSWDKLGFFVFFWYWHYSIFLCYENIGKWIFSWRTPRVCIVYSFASPIW